MANSTIHLLPAANTEAFSSPFDVGLNAPVSLYLVPAVGVANVPGSALVIIQRQSGADWFNTDALNGSTDPCAVLMGIGTFRAFRPAQQEPIGIDLVTGV